MPGTIVEGSMPMASPFFNSFPLEPNWAKWITLGFALANPFEEGSAAIADNSLEARVNALEKRQDEEASHSLSPRK